MNTDSSEDDIKSLQPGQGKPSSHRDMDARLQANADGIQKLSASVNAMQEMLASVVHSRDLSGPAKHASPQQLRC